MASDLEGEPVFILVLAPHCLDCCSFVVGFEVGKCAPSNVLVFEDHFGCSESIHFHMSFRTRLSSPHLI